MVEIKGDYARLNNYKDHIELIVKSCILESLNFEVSPYMIDREVQFVNGYIIWWWLKYVRESFVHLQTDEIELNCICLPKGCKSELVDKFEQLVKSAINCNCNYFSYGDLFTVLNYWYRSLKQVLHKTNFDLMMDLQMFKQNGSVFVKYVNPTL